MATKPIIIPVASGKGGVGKTLISVNLAFALASLGKRTILIDLDFGGANVHTCMGYDSAPDGIGNFLNSRNTKLEEYLLSTQHALLQLIPGDAEMVGIADILASQKRKLMNQITKLDADFVILDLGAGSSNNTIDFFMMSPYSIVVAMPELTSIFNAYALLKSSLFRLLFVNYRSIPEVKELFNKQIKLGGEYSWKIQDLLNKLFEIDPELHLKATALIESVTPKLIINMAENPKDIAMGERLRKISLTYLTTHIDYLGFLYRDKAVPQSIQQRSPLAISNVNNQTYQTIARIAVKIINTHTQQNTLYDINNFDASYEEILDEATDDLSSKIQGYSELADENLLTVNELISLVKNLEYDNLHLKKENEKLKYQIMKYRAGYRGK